MRVSVQDALAAKETIDTEFTAANGDGETVDVGFFFQISFYLYRFLFFKPRHDVRGCFLKGVKKFRPYAFEVRQVHAVFLKDYDVRVFVLSFICIFLYLFV